MITMGAFEFKDVILEVADDLYDDCKMTEYGLCRDEVRESKYIRVDYCPPERGW